MVYQFHTVCLHLLVPHCNYIHVFILSFFLLLFLIDPFLRVILCKNDPLAGPTFRLILVACLIVVFLWLVFEHAVSKNCEIQKKLSLDLSLNFMCITRVEITPDFILVLFHFNDHNVIRHSSDVVVTKEYHRVSAHYRKTNCAHNKGCSLGANDVTSSHG